MDLVTGQRTFTYALSGIANNSKTQCPFLDSAGNVINCNYIEVSVISEEAVQSQGSLVCEVSSVTATAATAADALPHTTVPSRGVCGMGTVVAKNPTKITWHGSNGEVATGVTLYYACQDQSSIGVPGVISIIYGNLLPINPLRLEQSYDHGS